MQRASAVKAHANDIRVRVRSHDEVILQPGLISVVDQVDSRIHAHGANPGEIRYPCHPLRAILTSQVAGAARQGIESLQTRAFLRAHKAARYLDRFVFTMKQNARACRVEAY